METIIKPDGKIEKIHDGTPVVWTPNPGFQQVCLAVEGVNEFLIWGNRGAGKTDCMVAMFLQNVGKGYGADYRGLIYRENHPNLHDLMGKAYKMISGAFPDAKFTSHPAPMWTFATGEELLFRFFEREEDYQKVHGWSIQFLGVDELVQYPDLKIYNDLKGLLRTTNPNILPRVVACSNTYGPNNQNMRDYFRPEIRDIQQIEQILERNKRGKATKVSYWKRLCIEGAFEENTHLKNADPGYMANLTMNLKDTDPEKFKSYVLASWDCVAGGSYLEGYYDDKVHVIDPFTIPRTWRISRGLDFGTVKPSYVGYFAEVGEETTIRDSHGNNLRFIKGDIILCDEIYTIKESSTPGEYLRNVGTEITARELAVLINNKDKHVRLQHGRRKIFPGAADTSIWQKSGTVTIASEMQLMGINWLKANKGKDSRIAGWEVMKSMLLNAKNPLREFPAFFIFNNCRHACYTLPILRRDLKKPEDVDSKCEDHCGDCIRYFMTMDERIEMGKMKGI